MTSINSFLRENAKKISDDNVFVAPNIPEKKLNGAISSYASSVNPENVIAIFDSTFFGSAKEGILFTGERAIYKRSLLAPIEFKYSIIKSVEHKVSTFDVLEAMIDGAAQLDALFSKKDKNETVKSYMAEHSKLLSKHKKNKEKLLICSVFDEYVDVFCKPGFNYKDKLNEFVAERTARGGVVELLTTDGVVIKFEYLHGCDYRYFANILRSCANEFNDHSDDHQAIPLGEMKEVLKERPVVPDAAISVAKTKRETALEQGGAPAILTVEEVKPQIESGDLYALLSVCSNEDLDPLVKFITKAFTNTLDVDEDYKKYAPNHQAYHKKIGDHLRRFGGNSFANAGRGGEGPSYDKIVCDICEKLGVPYVAGKTILNEDRLYTTQFDEPWEEQTLDERRKSIGRVRTKYHITNGIAFADSLSVLSNLNVGGKGGLAFALWKAAEPAFRVTIPSVLYITWLRRKHMLGGGMTLATAAAKIKRLQEEIERAALAFNEHKRLNEFVLCLWAVGYAMAACDGPVSEKERAAIAEFAAGASKDVISSELRNKIDELERNPPNFQGAMKYVDYLGREAWPCINDLLPFVASADETDEQSDWVSDAEQKFLDRWKAYKLVNAE